MMNEWTGYAESLEEALKRGLKKMGLTRDDVSIEVISERTSALFSMMDYRRVKVRLIAKPGVRPAAPVRSEQSDRDRSRPPQRNRFDDKRRRDERPGDRQDRDRKFQDRDRGGDNRDRDRNRDRGDRQRGDRDQRPQNRQDDQRRDQRNQSRDRDRGGDNRDRQRGDRDRSFRDRDQNRNRSQENRRPQFQQRDQQPSAPAPSQPLNTEVDMPQNIPADLPEITIPPQRTEAERFEQFSNPPQEAAAATPKEGLPPMDSAAIETQLARWKELLGWEDLAWSVQPSEGRRLPIRFTTAKAERLMGQRGETLEAFEYLFNLVLTQTGKDAPTVQFGMDGFEDPRAQRTIDLAKRAAAEVRRSRTIYRMDPMPPAERRIVHQALANEPDVETASEGEGPYRKVVVRLKSGAAPAAPKKQGPWVR